MKLALPGIVLTHNSFMKGGGGSLRMRLLQNVASNPDRLASHVLDNPISAPIIHRTFSVTVVSSPSLSANAQTECANVVHDATLFQKDLTGTTKQAKNNFMALPETSQFSHPQSDC